MDTVRQEGSGIDSSYWSLHDLALPVSFFSGCSAFLPQSNNVNIKLIEDPKLPLGVSDGLVTCPW